jgi:hypothetical protein
MRTEIYNRSNAQHTLINLNVTALGVIAGLVLTGRGDVQLLLLIPLVSTSIGLLYFDHSGAIERVGAYLDSILHPAVSSLTGDSHSLSWEKFASKAFQINWVSILAFAVPLFFLFLGGPIFATIIVLPSLQSAWAWALWSIDVVLQASLCGVWFSLVTGRSRKVNLLQAQSYAARKNETPRPS